MSDIMSYLFETNAIRFCEENKPFWYTSGKIGPYFINTHFVYGSENEAADLLGFIDECLADKPSLPEKVFRRVLAQYQTNSIYHAVIDEMKHHIESHINVEEIDYISGGERRDWFFSNILAYLFHKPHITIFKDLSTSTHNYDFTQVLTSEDYTGKKVLHVADLITIASSYVKMWIPTIRALGADVPWSCVVVDRMQGGKENLAKEGVTSLSLVNVDEKLFQKAFDLGIINTNQLSMLTGFFHHPDETMKEFLINHPEFIENSLKSDPKTQKRAKSLIDQNLYGLT